MVLHLGAPKLQHIRHCKICQDRIKFMLKFGYRPNTAIKKAKKENAMIEV